MVYPSLLGDDFEKLHASLRRLHSAGPGIRARGIVSVRHTNGLLAWLVGFPAAGEKIAVDLVVTAHDRGETWTPVRQLHPAIRTALRPGLAGGNRGPAPNP